MTKNAKQKRRRPKMINKCYKKRKGQTMQENAKNMLNKMSKNANLNRRRPTNVKNMLKETKRPDKAGKC